MNAQTITTYVGALALVGAGLALVVKGDGVSGWSLLVAGAAELGIKVVAPVVVPAPVVPPAA